jgi:proline iminopeptidase
MKRLKFQNFKLLIMISLLVSLLNCSFKKTLENREGSLQVKGGKVWYKIAGDGDNTPILVLHGGPGVPSYYLNPLMELGKDRKIIFYDQLGCGRSERITDTNFMNISYFVEELHEVVTQLGLKEFILLGQSWGCMLGIDYYLKYPQGIQKLIFCSPNFSTELWLQDADILISTLPDTIQKAIRENESKGTYDNPEYQNAMMFFYEHFVGRKLPWSEDVMQSMSEIGPSYQYMWGPSEFTVTGELKTYDRLEQLKNIKVPTLLMAGEFDEVTENTLMKYKNLIPGAQSVVIKGAAHMTMQDNPKENNAAISSFLVLD